MLRVACCMTTLPYNADRRLSAGTYDEILDAAVCGRCGDRHLEVTIYMRGLTASVEMKIGEHFPNIIGAFPIGSSSAKNIEAYYIPFSSTNRLYILLIEKVDGNLDSTIHPATPYPDTIEFDSPGIPVITRLVTSPHNN